MSVNDKSFDDDFNPEDMDFEALLEQEAGREQAVWISPGEQVSGEVVHIGERMAQLDLGNGFDGMLDLNTLPEDVPRPDVGDTVTGYALRIRNRVVELGAGMPRGAMDMGALHASLESGLPVEGKVTEVNKGGYVVEIGSHRGFCPLGQMDIRRIETPAELVGSALMFRVIEIREGRDPVLSRRALLEAERAAMAVETREKLAPGARFRGRVTSVRDFGFFVDIGGLEGLVHVSELPYGKRRPADAVSPGDTVEVECLRIELATVERDERIALSMRSLAADPFDGVAAELPAGTVVKGVVTRIQPYGAFVELAVDVEGLVHVSAFGKRIGTPSDVVYEGQEVMVRIKDVDVTLRRISLAWIDPERLDELVDVSGDKPGNSLNIEVVGVARDADPDEGRGEASGTPVIRPVHHGPPSIGAVLNVVVERHSRFGLFASWAPQNGQPPGEGLLPISELGVAFGGEARRKFPVGSTFKAAVLDVRPDGKVRLSKTQAEDIEQKNEARAWLAEHNEAPPAPKSEQVGSLGELLKEKLGL